MWFGSGYFLGAVQKETSVDRMDSGTGVRLLSSRDFPRLAVRQSPGPTRVRESERLLGETVMRKTEQYTDQTTGETKVRTIEIVEKLIEKEVASSKNT